MSLNTDSTTLTSRVCEMQGIDIKYSAFDSVLPRSNPMGTYAPSRVFRALHLKPS